MEQGEITGEMRTKDDNVLLKDLVPVVARLTSKSKETVATVVNEFLFQIISEVAKGNRVTIEKFGSFALHVQEMVYDKRIILGRNGKYYKIKSLSVDPFRVRQFHVRFRKAESLNPLLEEITNEHGQVRSRREDEQPGRTGEESSTGLPKLRVNSRKTRKNSHLPEMRQ